MVYFQTKNPKLGKFWRTLGWKMLVNFKAIWSTYLLAFGIFYDHWYILCSFGTFFRFGIMQQDKSGNPSRESNSQLTSA
jgi:hypothetical protein